MLHIQLTLQSKFACEIYTSLYNFDDAVMATKILLTIPISYFSLTFDAKNCNRDYSIANRLCNRENSGFCLTTSCNARQHTWSVNMLDAQMRCINLF